jgi:thiol-disulfide isomerase/thioredoxin
MKSIFLRSYLFFLLLPFSFILQAQTNVTVIMKGDNRHLVTRVDMFDIEQKEFVDHSQYKDTLQFRFTKTDPVARYSIRYFVNDKRYMIQPLLDDSDIIIHARMDSDEMYIDTIINSPIQTIVKNFDKAYGSSVIRGDKNSLSDFLLQSIHKYINSPYSIEIAQRYLTANADISRKEYLYKLRDALAIQGDKFAWYYYYNRTWDQLNTLLDNDVVDLSSFEVIGKNNVKSLLSLSGSKFYLLDFWFLGCAPCREDHKIIKANPAFFEQHSIQIIGISTDDYSNAWEQYLSSNGYDWRNYLQVKDNLKDFFKVDACPKYFMLNADMKVIGVYGTIEHVLNDFESDIVNSVAKTK